METTANSSHVVYDNGHSYVSEEIIPSPQGFEPSIVNCQKNSAQIGASKGPIDNIFVRLARAGDSLDTVGGLFYCETSDEEAQEAARFAVEEYNRIEGLNLELDEVVAAEWGIGSGTIYHLVLKVSSGLFFNAEVMVMAEGPPEFLSFEQAEDYVG